MSLGGLSLPPPRGIRLKTQSPQPYTNTDAQTNAPRAAVWWRVSTDSQDTSPDTQIADALGLAKSEGYHVPPDYIIGADWHSLSVWSSPPMDKLKALILQRSINAVFLYDADRGPSKPLHRLMFQALCEDNGVDVRCVHGQVPKGEMAEVVQFLSAWAKEKQVQRGQQGSRDGLRDRAKLRGLPTNGTPSLGYRFRYESDNGKPVPVALEPDGNHAVAADIYRKALDGWSLGRIAESIQIPPLRGGRAWYPSTVAKILKNPIYGGRYYALRQQARNPTTRSKAGTYRKSSSPLPSASWVLLDFPIESPVVSWGEWESVQRKLKQNQQDSRRNAKRDYQLRGMLFCSQDGRRLCGHTRRNSYVYECPGRRGRQGIPKCDCPVVHGPSIENHVWETVSSRFCSPIAVEADLNHLRDAGNGQEAREINDAIAACERKLRDVTQRETRLLSEKLHGSWTDDALSGAAATLRAERVHYQDEIERHRESLTAIAEFESFRDSLMAFHQRTVMRMATANASDRRDFLTISNLRVEIQPDGRPAMSITVPRHVHSALADYEHCTQGQ